MGIIFATDASLEIPIALPMNLEIPITLLINLEMPIALPVDLEMPTPLPYEFGSAHSSVCVLGNAHISAHEPLVLPLANAPPPTHAPLPQHTDPRCHIAFLHHYIHDSVVAVRVHSP